MDSKKRDRAANFSNSETRLLLSIVLMHIHIIENKKTDAVMWKTKNDAWEKIADDFNAQSGHVYRSSKVLRLKYDVLKRQLKKKISNNKFEMYKTGGGPYTEVPLTDFEEKLKQILSLSIDGLPCRNDSDISLTNLDKENKEETLVLKFVDDENASPVRSPIAEIETCEEFFEMSNVLETHEMPSTSKILKEQRGNISNISGIHMPSTSKILKEQRGNISNISGIHVLPSTSKILEVEEIGETSTQSNIMRKTSTPLKKRETPSKSKKQDLYNKYSAVAETRKDIVAIQLQLLQQQKSDHDEEYQYKMKNLELQRENLKMEREKLQLQKDIMLREEARRKEEHALKKLI